MPRSPPLTKIDETKNDPEWYDRPKWYDCNDPLQAAVKYLSTLSPRFNWVGIYLLKGDFLELGPFIGEPTIHTRIPVAQGICGRAVSEDRGLNIADVRTEANYLACSLETRSELVVLIRDRNGRAVGQIDIDSHTRAAFGTNEEEQVREVAKVLGQRW